MSPVLIYEKADSIPAVVELGSKYDLGSFPKRVSQSVLD